MTLKHIHVLRNIVTVTRVASRSGVSHVECLEWWSCHQLRRLRKLLASKKNSTKISIVKAKMSLGRFSVGDRSRARTSHLFAAPRRDAAVHRIASPIAKRSAMPCKPVMNRRYLSASNVPFILLLLLTSVLVRKAAAWSPPLSRQLRSAYPTQFRVFSTLSDNNGDEDDIESPEELRQALWEMSRIPSRQSLSTAPDIAYSVPNMEDLEDDTVEGGSTKQSLKNQYPEYPGRITNDDDANVEPQHGPTVDGWFLDENDYINSRSHLNPDGSLSLNESDDITNTAADEEYQKLTENLLRVQSPNVPSSLLSPNNDKLTLESLLQQTPQDPNATSEELHRQVFEQEEGYLKQSEVFRKSLGADGSQAAVEAARLRRGAEYRKRQDEAISKLNKEIADFEAHLNDTPKEGMREKCFKCGCALSEEELKQFRSQNDAPASRRLCSVCYGDLLVAKSDKSFFRDVAVAPGKSGPYPRRSRRQPPMNGRPPAKRRDNVLPPTRRTVSPPMSNIRGQPPVAKSKERSVTVDMERDDIEMLKKEVMALKDELQRVKHDGEFLAGDEGGSGEVWEESPELEANWPWSQVIDPDTGEIFYWNEETEEMKWEL